MSYNKQITVPDTSGNMAVAATPLEASSFSLTGVTRISAASSVVVWMMHAPSGTPTAADVVANGTEIIRLTSPVQLLDPGNGNSPPDASRFFFATISGAGDVRAIAG